MIGKVLVVLLLSAIPSARAQAESVEGRSATNPLVGTWRLVRYTDTPEDGHRSVQIMHNPPNPKDAVVDPDPDACIPGWFCAYFGTYTVDVNGRSWVAQVLGGNILAYIGTAQKRAFTVEGDRLVISETYLSGEVPVTAERVLVRSGGAQN